VAGELAAKGGAGVGLFIRVVGRQLLWTGCSLMCFFLLFGMDFYLYFCFDLVIFELSHHWGRNPESSALD
jgi:hypothetical protein